MINFISFRKSFTLLIIVMFFFITPPGFIIKAQVNCTLLDSATLTHQLFPPSFTAGEHGKVVFDPNFENYYSYQLGSASSRLVTYDIDGTVLSSGLTGFDYRGSWFNPLTDSIEVALFFDSIYLPNRTTVGILQNNGNKILPGNQPHPQTLGDFDPNNNEILYYFNGLIHRYSRVNNTFNSFLSITGLPVPLNFINPWTVIYTNCNGYEYGILDRVNHRVLFINRTTGAYVGASYFDTNVPSIFGFSYANSLGWIYHADSLGWLGYQVLRLCSTPTANFTYSNVCDGDTIYFTDASTFTEDSIVEYNWNFGDGIGTSPAQNPFYVYDEPGIYPVSLEVTNSCGNSHFFQQFISVYPNPEADFSFTTVCSNEDVEFTDLTTIGNDPPGSTINSWSWDFGDGIGSSSLQNPFYSYASGGTYDVTLVVQSNNGCVDSITQQVTVNYLPEPAFTFSPACVGEINFFNNSTTVTAGSISSYAWNLGDGSTSTASNPVHVYNNAGIYDVTLIATTNFGCVDSVTNQLEVYPLPNVSISPISNVCIDNGIFTLTQGNFHPDGTYSGTGVDANGNFNPATAGVGTHTINYSYTNANGCSNSASTSITVHPLPNVTLDPIPPVCENDDPFTLTGGNPSGGQYFVNGFLSTEFDPVLTGSGTHQVIYEFTNANGCTNSASRNVTVHPTPVVSVGPFNGICENASPFTLTGGNPAGGDYIINGDLETTFDPGLYGVGVHTIFYAFENTTGCSDTAFATIEVFEAPMVTFIPLADVCIDESQFALTGGTPASGVYSGSGVSGGEFFTASVAGSGTHTINYSYTDVNGCTNSALTTITVNPLPVVTLDPFPDMCEDDDAFTLTGGNPIGGQYFVNGVLSTEFDPAVTGSGTHQIVYEFTDANGCTNSASRNITVHPTPVVSVGPFSGVCENAPTFTLTSGNPTGGQYIVNGNVVTTFNPSAYGAGTQTIFYAYESSSGCRDTASATIEIFAAPSISINPLADVCINEPAFPLTGGSPSGGTYSGSGVSGNNFFAQSAGVGTHTITYTFSDTNGCTNSESTTITVNPLPVVTLDSFPDVCEEDDAFTLTGGNPSGGQYFVNGNPSTEFDPSVTGSGTHQIVYEFTDADGCTNSASRNITVHPSPAVSVGSFSGVCENAAPFTLTSGNPTGGQYIVDGNVVTTFNPSIYGVGTQIIFYAYANSSNCRDTASATIEIFAAPVVTMDSLADVCLSEPSFPLTGGSPSGGTYSGQGVSGNNFFAQSAGLGTHTITYTYTDANGCTNSASTTITVQPAPTVTLDPIPSVCVDAEAFTLTGGSPSGGQYFVNGVPATEFDPAVTGSGTHQVTYEYTDATGCTNSANRNVVVHPLPVVSVGSFNPVCENSPSFTLTSATPTGGEYIVNGNVVTTFNPSDYGVGTQTIFYTYENSNGCRDTASAIIEIIAVPVVTMDSLADVCLSDPSFPLTGGSPSGGTYSGPGVSGNNFFAQSAGLGTHTITYTYTDPNSCTNSASTTITVSSAPTVTLDPIPPVCEDADAFTLTGGNPSGGQYFVNGVLSTELFPAFTGSGTHQVTYEYTDATGCTNSASVNVTVYPLPIVSVGPFSPVCVNSNPFLMTSGVPSGGDYIVNGNVVTNFDPSLYGVGVQTIFYAYENLNGCRDTASATIEIFDEPQITFDPLDDVCIDESAFPLYGGSPAGGTYSGPGVSGNNFFAQSAGLGTHTIFYTYTDSNSCTAVESTTITVNPIPFAIIFPVGSTDICKGDSTILNAITVTDYTFQWLLNGDSIAGATDSAYVVYTEGTYQVIVTDANGCTNTSNAIMVTVNEAPVAQFKVEDVCFGTTTQFVNQSTVVNGVLGFEWLFGDGSKSTDINPAHNYSSPGVYDVTLITNSNKGCNDTAFATVEVFPQPVASFSTQNICFGNVIEFENLSNNAGAAVTYEWNFGDGNTSSDFNPIHQYTSAGTYIVTMIVSSENCSDEYSKEIEVYPVPTVMFSADNGCVGSEVSFTNLTTTTQGGISYTWDFGDGNTTTTINPVHTYDSAGIYVVTLTALTVNGCLEEYSATVIVFPQPEVKFVSSGGCFGQEFQFTNLSILQFGDMTYIWTFGDGGSSTDKHAVHTYQQSGTYQVILTATSDYGCQDVYSKHIQVYPPPTANFSVQSVCEGESVSFTNFSTVPSGSLSYQWSFGDGSGSFDKEPMHTYSGNGSFTVTLVAHSGFGCTDTIQRTVTIHPKPVTDFLVSDICFGENVFFENLTVIDTGSITQYYWDFGDGNVSFQTNPSHFYWESGEYFVSLIATSDKGCVNGKQHTVGVHPEPEFEIVAKSETEFCDGGYVQLEVTPKVNYTYEWSTGDFTHIIGATESGWHSVTVTNLYGCEQQDSILITVFPLPEIEISNDTVISKGYAVQLYASGGETYVWLPAESLNQNNIPTPVASPLETTTYTVVVTDSNQCQSNAIVTIVVFEDYTLEIPNLFTPNNDGYNDTWEIGNIETYPDVEVVIFNRWGSEVFSSKAYQNEWDGTLNGTPLPDGTYYYVISFEGSQRLYKGTVSIMR